MTGTHHQHTPDADGMSQLGSPQLGSAQAHSMGEEHQGHGGHSHSGHVAMFRRAFWFSVVLAIPTVALSPMFGHLVGYQVWDNPIIGAVPPVLGTVLYLGPGRIFLAGALTEIRSRAPGMMLLIGLALTVAFAASWGATLGWLPAELDFWWELALLVVIMLLGHWMEMKSLAATGSALARLADLLPQRVSVVRHHGAIDEIAPSQLAVGDVVVVRPGGRIPADGVVVEGEAAVDESLITGESAAVHRGVGDAVVAGTVATDSGVRVQVGAVGDDTVLAGIGRLVAQAQAATSRAQRLADTAAGWLFWFALGSAVLAAAIWWWLDGAESAVVRAVSVLVIACPHALGLAIPLVVALATERAAKGGILISDRRQLEAMRTVDVVVFDKTGTLTLGRPTVQGVWALDGTEVSLLQLAASAEAASEHPLARAIVRAAAERGAPVLPAVGFTSTPATGVRATVAGAEVHVGGPRLLDELGLTAPLGDGRGADLGAVGKWPEQGLAVVYVVVDRRLVGALALADEVRPESAEAVRRLQADGVQVVMMTGDDEPVAAAVAARVGIDRWFAKVRPEDKADQVALLQGEGHRVAMVGDGVNDAPALARADVGLAIGAGTDVAIAAAGVVLASDDPRSVVQVRRLSFATYRKSVQNLAWGAGYNVIAVPLAAGVLAPWGITLPMSVGAVLMSASTVVVALNAQTLRRLDLRPDAL